MNRKLAISEVPCNGCTLCCQQDAIRLLPEDNPAEYQTVPHPHIAGALMLAHKQNGECIYLNEYGCSIHRKAPSLCRGADCRTLAARMDFETARKLHLMNKLNLCVWDQGHKLLEAMRKQLNNSREIP